MKKTFTTIDVASIVAELKEQLIGLRVNQIYDIDHKTYLLKLQKPDCKVVILFESASRIHTTEYEWPKSPAPSGFSMKLRKHLRNKRLENIQQLGVDRVVDLSFGSEAAATHLIIELYDRGNIVLTDGDYNILNVLRPRKDGEDTKIAVREKYPIENARQARDPPTIEDLQKALSEAKENTPLKKILNPMLDCGGGVLEHELLSHGFPTGAKVGKDIKATDQLNTLLEAVTCAQNSISQVTETKGFIIKKAVDRPKGDGTIEQAHLYMEFHPRLYMQNVDRPVDEFINFNKACDEFFSKLEANELDKKTVEKEKQALKKLENVKKDHEKRIQQLKGRQEIDLKKGQLIELNQELVDGALLVIRSAIANQIDWVHIHELLEEAQGRNDKIACCIRDLKLATNTMTLWLSDPYNYDENDMLLDSDEEREEGTDSEIMRPTAVEIDLDLSALANARKYFDLRRQAAKKEQKTIDASSKAIKSAEKKTQQTLKEVSAIAKINKARKVHWFEKFIWFVSSENYLVIGGRDGQQNEMVVKRHLKPKDVYVHGDLHGASSVIIKNPTGANVPPKTLNEAGVMALCYSRAWDEKVVTSAWWVWGHQVSKTAPTGEYLTTGAFMVRGKKNFLPPSHLIYGFGFLFRLEESSIERHAGERKVRMQDEQFSLAITDAIDRLNCDEEEHEEISLNDDDDDECNPLETVDEEKKEDECNSIPSESSSVESDQADLKDIPLDEVTKATNNEQLNTDKEQEIKNSEAEEGKLQFPDTELEMSHLTGDQFTIKLRTNSDTGSEKQHDTKVKEVPKNKNKGVKESSGIGKSQEMKPPPPGPIKRGQKGKLKKMKKYKDQDEEERELRMQLLQSAGAKKYSKKEKSKMERVQKMINRRNQMAVPKPSNLDKNREPKNPGAAEDLDEEEVPQIPDDLSILESLTAIPVPEDEILYAIPVCAPYSAMNNYKFKVKLIPGPGKKGKATKTALSLFMADKTSSSREKDLFRAIKDHDLAKNIPGKVKISAPNINKYRK